MREVGSYALFGIGGQYRFKNDLTLSFGVTNLTDKRLLRESNSSGAGAATYNEVGRAYYLSLNARF